MSGRKKGTIASSLALLWLTFGWVRGSAADSASSAYSDRDDPVPFNLSARPSLCECGAAVRARDFTLSLSGVPKAGDKPGLMAPGPRPKKRIGLAWLEMGTMMTVSTVNYWIEYSKFINDWQWELTWHDQSYRFFTLGAWRFDSNDFKLNWTHSLAGGLYYQFSRTNDLSWLQSWLMSISGSFFWEYIAEWREVISINDQFMTGLAGFAIGEPFFQITNYFSRQPGLVYGALSFLNPLIKINRWLNRKDPGAKTYVPPSWHDFGIFAAARRMTTTGQTAETSLYLGMHARIFNPPQYGQPGEVREHLTDTYFSEISGDYAIRNGHADETNFVMSAVPWGFFRQSLNDARDGYSLTWGLGSSLEYYKKRPLLDAPGSFTDKLAVLHIIGPVVDWTIFHHGLKVRTVAEAYFDFGLINALALNEYSLTHDISTMKSTVATFGYFYGFGGTLQANTNVDWGNFRARGLLSFGAWGSADFRDRFGYVANNAHLDDNRFRYLIGTGWKIPRAPLELFVNFEGLRRWGRVEETSVHKLEKRLFTGLEFLF